MNGKVTHSAKPKNGRIVIAVLLAVLLALPLAACGSEENINKINVTDEQRKALDEKIGEEKGNMTDVYIHHLRKRLEEPYGIRVISTVRGVGYRLDTRWIRMNES